MVPSCLPDAAGERSLRIRDGLPLNGTADGAAARDMRLPSFAPEASLSAALPPGAEENAAEAAAVAPATLPRCPLVDTAQPASAPPPLPP